MATTKRTVDRLHAVADPDLEDAVGILQFSGFNDGLALAADVDKRHLGPNRHDRAFDRLPSLELSGLSRRCE